MRETTSGRKYARAVLEIALQRKQLESWRTWLKELARILQEPPVRNLMENPRAAFSLRKQLLEDKLKGQEPMLLNLALLLASRGRTGLAGGIAAAYEDMLNQQYGIQPAEVTAAVPLDEAEKEKLVRYLSGVTGKKVIVSVRVDPAIIGGIVARAGDRLIDGSIRTRLDQLKRSLA